MDLAAGMRWRKAMVISLVAHSIVLIVIGWIVAKAFIPVDIPETLIELEIVSESVGPDLPSAPDMSPMKPSQAAAVGLSEALVRTTRPEAVVSEPAVAVDTMSVLAVESSSIPAGSVVAGAAGGTGTTVGSGTGTGDTSKAGKSREIIPPGILSRKEPPYPETARSAGQEGTVVLKIQILENGRPGQVSIYQSSGYDLLDDAAAGVVQRWRFVPAKIRDTGQSIVCYTTMHVVFKLKS
ncbi:energy transducer TonB [Sporomusa sp.]|uniref:energy transducer TonB n=1 Tax=Sporomusa sp. TaxID=2078658 RepID=UPI002C75CD54|nr:energy transducer TonB [Sporomusa sp.]HWR44886.1 energy transducer TonB [Sporomusa sp.]